MTKRTNIGDLSYPHQHVIEAMKGQLLIALINRLGGTVEMPVAEVDRTGRFNLAMKLNPDTRTLTFVVEEKRR